LLVIRPGGGGAGWEPGDRFDIVPDPQHRLLLEDSESDLEALGIVEGKPVDAVALEDIFKRLADLI
jgi:hypothetical protein